MSMWSFVPKIRPLFSAARYYNDDADQATATAAPSPTITFHFKVNVRKIEVTAERRAARRTEEQAAVVRDLRRFAARLQSRDQFLRELESDVPLIGTLPAFAQSYIKQHFPRFVRSAVARTASDRGLQDLSLTVDVTAKAYSSAFCCDQCPICLEGFCEEALPSDNFKMLPCGHGFHRSCVLEWLRKKPTCPTCRQSLTKPPGFD